MPIVDEDQLRTLLSKGGISALTVDTCIFDEKKLQFNSPPLQALAKLNGRGFRFMLPNTVGNEVIRHLEEEASASFKSARREIGQALRAFGTKDPTRDELLNQITGARTPTQVAEQYFGQYVKDSGCEILNDAELVDTGTLFGDYFTGRAPFGSGKKKNEFPDALALNALERTACDRGFGILIVTKDRDWKEFCRNSQHLYLITSIERALALVANAPRVLRKSVLDWLEDETLGGANLESHLAEKVQLMDFGAIAYPSLGQCELDVWAGELQGVILPEGDDIDIIEVEHQEDRNWLRLVVSVPLVMVAKIPVDVNFFIWDSVDKESLSMGGRTIEFDDEIATEATIALDIFEQGTEDEEIVFVDVEIVSDYHEVDLGEVDLFEKEEYDFDDGEPLGE